MLHELRIRDLGVIQDATLDLHPGLTVLTGETGAGKTMVLSGLALLCGARADAALVRTGAARTVVEGVHQLPAEHPAMERALEAGADVEDGLVLVRSVSSDGRSRAHVGGRSAPVGVLAELADSLLAVHGQADQWRLRRPNQHRELVDAFGGEAHSVVLAHYRATYAAHAAAVAELSALRVAATDRAREAEMLRLGLERIESVNPEPGEDRSLRVEDERHSHAEELRRAASTAHSALAGDDEAAAGAPAAVVDLIHHARAALTSAADADPDLAALGDRVAELGYLAADLAADLSSYLGAIDVDPARLAWVQDRRASLAALTRVYGESIDEVISWSGRAAARVAELEATTDRIDELAHRVDDLAAGLVKAGGELTSSRERAAATLGLRITQELAELAMSGSVVRVAVEPADRPGPEGADTVEIQLASGSGSPARSVTKAASGGELSRVMLAIEVATAADHGDAVTFVFDEVDAGVGGRAALAVGARLAQLAQSSQVIVVTHLAQVAAHADRHLVVERADDGSVVASGVRAVEGEDRVLELARMLGGTDGAAAVEHARDLLGRASRQA